MILFIFFDTAATTVLVISLLFKALISHDPIGSYKDPLRILNKILTEGPQ